MSGIRENKDDNAREGMAGAILSFLEALKDMEKKNERIRAGAGELEGPFGSRTKYRYVVKIGLNEKAIAGKKGVPKDIILPPGIIVEAFEDKGSVTVLAMIPGVKAEDVALDIKGDTLSMTIKSHGGVRKKKVRVYGADLERIEDVTEKNSVFTIRIGKRGE